MPDAVVVGSGPNGLVAANVLAERGWSVVVLEANESPGGAVRSDQALHPGFVHDRYSSFYPLAAVSPAIVDLHLERHGLVWTRAPTPLAHAFPDGTAAVVGRSVSDTAESVERMGRGDGRAWEALHAEWSRVAPDLLLAIFGRYPPLWRLSRLAVGLGNRQRVAEFVRTMMLPVGRLASERFRGKGAAMLLAGSTAHTDLSPTSALGSLYALMLTMVGQDHGFPVPQGGAGKLTDALVRRLVGLGGQVICGSAVQRVVLRRGRAVGVVCGDGTEIAARRAVVAAVGANQLYMGLVGLEHLPPHVVAGLGRLELGHGVFKVDWALGGKIPWRNPQVGAAGTVHVGSGLEALSRSAVALAEGFNPKDPFLIAGQMTRADPSRSPVGTESAWAYSHVPRLGLAQPGVLGSKGWEGGEKEAMADRLEEAIEGVAPGFRQLILDRRITSPADLEAADANLVGGSIDGGTAQLHQQLFFRPIPGRSGPRTAFGRLYLASSSAHPGGGVHGACGANAARAALWDLRLLDRPGAQRRGR